MTFLIRTAKTGAHLSLIVALSVSPVAAQSAFQCAGTSPSWSVEIAGDTAQFVLGTEIDMQIPQQGQAEGRDWPKVMTLLGGRDTAIVILHERRCDTSEVTGWPIEATILTQRSESPVVLAGCCLPG